MTEIHLQQFVFLIEDEPKHMAALAEGLHRLEPTLQIRMFQGLTWFLDWMKEAKTGPAQLHRAGYGFEKNLPLPQVSEETNLALVIVSESLLGLRKKELLEKFSDWFEKKQLFKAGSQVPVMVTSYQHNVEVLKTFQLKPIHQILFKPFDAIQLDNNLRMSLAQSLKIKTPDVYPIQKSSRCELLQPVETLWLSEFGLFSRSTQPVQIGSVNKYYCSLFDSKPNHSLIGITVQSWREKPDENIWIHFVKFIGLDSIQIRQLKQNTSGKIQPTNTYIQSVNEHLKDPSQFRLVNALIICRNKDIRNHLKKILTESFANINVILLDKLQDYSHFLEHKGTMLAGQRAPEYLDFVLVDQEFSIALQMPAQKALVAKTQERFQLQNQTPIQFLLTSDSPLEKAKEFQLAHLITDILYTPLDSSFVKRKLKICIPQLILSEDASFDFAICPLPVQSADSITAHSLSEFSFEFDSNRRIDVSEFRAITLWETNEIEMPVLDGKCTSREPHPSDQSFFRYRFSFFGLTHKELQKVRYWTSQNLVKKT